MRMRNPLFAFISRYLLQNTDLKILALYDSFLLQVVCFLLYRSLQILVLCIVRKPMNMVEIYIKRHDKYLEHFKQVLKLFQIKFPIKNTLYSLMFYSSIFRIHKTLISNSRKNRICMICTCITSRRCDAYHPDLHVNQTVDPQITIRDFEET